MEAHGGTLTAESKEGRGSVFIAEFPRAAPSVLIVEDEEDWLILLRHELDKMNGFINTRSARNGVEALEIIKNHPPDVIISDIMMPVMTGLELLESVRRNFSTRNTPFIIITSSDERELRETALRMGANDFLIKPFAPDEFVPRIGRFVR
jgi:two-component system response regulator AdeR